ncbi:hypothetical protein BDV98DRAFT_517787 [Pterulicium gracile]|uniref:Uncharacterized protein n=1 Tax=Pterulicium gracile TaxID=1884261 RepID=A0A5C3Q0A3_9AGAR|nr:hypothetical protein BDV98DRAFT_517787 [Pterula gracilis]
MAMRGSSGDSAVLDFVNQLFHVVNYARRHRVGRSRRNLDLVVYGELTSTRIDFSLYSSVQKETFLIVQVDIYHEGREVLQDSQARVVASALAAFTENNANRERMGLPQLEHKVIPGIIMNGTSPTFFMIPVSEELITHVRNGTYPSTPTVVHYCFPPIPASPRRRSNGMVPLESRREILQCFEAFKGLVGI